MSLSRSQTMARVKSKNTSAELKVRRLLSGLGYRYRLHRKDIPGTPDIAFIGRRRVIFVHGCFWHGHNCKRGSRIPKTNAQYWNAKIEKNRARDKMAHERLTALGWKALNVWECELREQSELASRLQTWLERQ